MGAYMIEIGENSESGRCDGQHTNSSCSSGQAPGGCVIEYVSARNQSEMWCWKIPLRIAVFIIAAVEILGVTANLVLVIVAYSALDTSDKESELVVNHGTTRDLVFEYVERHPRVTMACSAVGAALTYLVVALLLIGTTRKKPCLFIPHMVMQICAIFALLIPSAVYGLHAAHTTARANNGENSSVFKSQLIFDIVALEAFLISFALDLYFLYIVFRYFRILRKQNSENAHA